MADNGEKEQVTLTIDGHEVTVDKGTTVIEAAAKIGIEIPYFCWHPKLDSVGACRMCLVHVEKMPKPAVACATEVMPGMIVKTDTEEIIKARRGVLEFLLLNHPLDCPTCDKGGECDLQDNVFHHGLDKSRQTFVRHRVLDERTKGTFDDKRIGPEIVRNMNRCVTCFKCVRFNKEIAGEFDLGAYQRGHHTVIDTPPGQQIDNLYSGNNVEICPVGALTNTDWRYKVRNWITDQAPSIAPYDADGQNIMLWYDRRQIFRATSNRNDAVDEGWICDISRYGYQYVNAEDRLTTPLIRREGKQVEASWEEAIALIAKRFKEIKENKGSVCISGIIGDSQSTETCYVFNKFFRTVLKTNSLDHRLEYIDLRETDVNEAYECLCDAPFEIAPLEKADTVLIFGSNFIKDHPSVNLRLRKAWRKNGARVFTANPVETKSADISIDEMIYAPDTAFAFLVALTHAVIDEKVYKVDQAVASSIKDKLIPATLDKAAAECGIEKERFTGLAKSLGTAGNLYILAGEFLKAAPSRYQQAKVLYMLANLLGVDDSKAAILASHANSKGTDRVGVRSVLPAYLSQKLESLWGKAIPDSDGSNTSRIFKAALDEEIDAAFILGANPAMQYPDGPFARAALDKLDFVVVADLFETATTEKADVVLPLAGWSEQQGSFVNLEGRQQRFMQALPPKSDDIKTGIEIIGLIADALEAELKADPTALAAETKEVLAAWKRTPRDIGKVFELKPPAVVEHADYPYKLLVGNDLHHYGYYTEHCPSLMRFTSEPYLELSASLAQKLEIEEGMLVRIESTTGKLVLKAKISEFFEGEVLFVPNNFSATEVTALVSHENSAWVKLEKLDDK